MRRMRTAPASKPAAVRSRVSDSASARCLNEPTTIEYDRDASTGDGAAAPVVAATWGAGSDAAAGSAAGFGVSFAIAATGLDGTVARRGWVIIAYAAVDATATAIAPARSAQRRRTVSHDVPGARVSSRLAAPAITSWCVTRFVRCAKAP